MLLFFFQRSISENSLVAMDFSGQKSRVIDNPTEALSVAVEEGLAWRVQIGSHSLKILMIWVCFTQKVEMFSFFVQKKGCLRLGTHGSPTASSQSSAASMGRPACPLPGTAWGWSRRSHRGLRREVRVRVMNGGPFIHCFVFCFFSDPPVPAVVSPPNF